VHNGAVGTDRSPDDIVCVLQINDDRLGGGVGFVVDLAHAHVLVGFEGLGELLVLLLTADHLRIPHTQFCHDIEAGCVYC
jgi:hypothetical protein